MRNTIPRSPRSNKSRKTDRSRKSSYSQRKSLKNNSQDESLVLQERSMLSGNPNTSLLVQNFENRWRRQNAPVLSKSMSRITSDKDPNQTPIVIMGACIRDSEQNFNNRYLRPMFGQMKAQSPGRLGDPDCVRSSRSVPAMSEISSRPRASIQDFKSKITKLE